MLRPRVLLVLALMAVIFAAAGAAAMFITSRLNDAIATQYEVHYPTVVALEKIKNAASRLNGAVAMKMGGRDDDGYLIFHQNAQTLSENLAALASVNISPSSEKSLARLREQINILLTESERIVNQSPERVSAAVGYSQLLSPRVLEIVETADEILQTQKADIQRQRDDLLGQGRRAAILWWAAMILAGALIILGYRYIEQQIFNPVKTLDAAVRQIGEGELDQMVSVTSDNEVGRLSLSFNQMAGQLRATRKGTTEKLMRLHRTMQATLASFPNPFFVLGKDRTIELRNPAADKLAVKLFLEGQAKLPPVIYEHIDRVLETRQNYLPNNLKDALTVHVDNEEKFFLPRVLLLFDERGNTFGVAVVLEDVTNQRLLDDVKTNLLSTVSHELKTPLTSVRMALHLLLENSIGPLNPSQFDLLTTAKEDSERLLRTLNNLLDLTRLEEATPQLDLVECTVRELVESIAEEFRDTLAVSGHILNIDLGEDLPGIKIDREKTSHIFSNYLTNASKHSPEGSTITIRARSVLDDQVRISVIDQGTGISREDQERVFEKFFRVPGQTRTGAGLGLSIAREIALLHGGSVGVISEPGKGSEFYLDLPAITRQALFS